MIENLINEIEQAMLNTLNNEQLSQLRKVLEYTFRNVSVTESSNTTTAESNSELVKSFQFLRRINKKHLKLSSNKPINQIFHTFVAVEAYSFLIDISSSTAFLKTLHG